MIIILSGFKASGKTTLARYFSKHYQYQFIDIDDCILNIYTNEKQYTNIGQLYKSLGPVKFREIEQKAVVKLAQDLSNDIHKKYIIALGGGTVLNLENYNLLSKLGVIVYLEASQESITSRIKSLPELPELFKNKINSDNNIDQVLVDYYKSRLEVYNKNCNFKIDVSNKTIEQIAQELSDIEFKFNHEEIFLNTNNDLNSKINKTVIIISEYSLKKIDKTISVIEQDTKISQYIDIYELRLDFLNNIDSLELDDFAILFRKISKPVIITIRTEKDGGKYSGSEQNRIELLIKLSSLNPDYIDLEYYVEGKYIEKIKQQSPGCRIIRSYHDFCTDTQQLDLNKIVNKLHHPDCSIYKLSTMANSSTDCLVILKFLKDNAHEINLSAHCMGKMGVSSRVLSKRFSSCFTYCYYKLGCNFSSPQAPGLLSIQELIHDYNFQNINSESAIYALLGHPVEHSVGHKYHNNNFRQKNINATYVKFDVLPEEFDIFIMSLKKFRMLGFCGLSITMPYKNDIIKYLDKNYSKISSAVNTVKIKNFKFYGINTDGDGCLNVIKKNSGQDLIGKRVLILGAGGAAAAIAASANEHKAKLTLANRTITKAQEIVKQYGGDYISLDELYESYRDKNKFDIIISTLPESVTYQAHTTKHIFDTNLNTNSRLDRNSCSVVNPYLLEVLRKLSYQDTIFMDINYNKPIVLSDVKNISGIEMFFEQADLQFKYWFNDII